MNQTLNFTARENFLEGLRSKSYTQLFLLAHGSYEKSNKLMFPFSTSSSSPDSRYKANTQAHRHQAQAKLLSIQIHHQKQMKAGGGAMYQRLLVHDPSSAPFIV